MTSLRIPLVPELAEGSGVKQSQGKNAKRGYIEKGLHTIEGFATF